MGIYALSHANERMKYVSELFFQISLKLKVSPIKNLSGKEIHHFKVNLQMACKSEALLKININYAKYKNDSRDTHTP